MCEGNFFYDLYRSNNLSLMKRSYSTKELIEALIGNTSAIQPKVIHSDTQGKSTALFALSYLFGIELMPRIHHWKDLKFYRPKKETVYKHIDILFKDIINWVLRRRTGRI